MKVYLLGFRGVGFKHTDEPALIRAGHVGWQFEGDERIFGFHPTDAAIEAAGGEEAALRLLKDEHDTLEGAVQIDTAIFERAFELAATLAARGETRIPQVWLQTIDLSDDDFERVKAQTEIWYTEQKMALYGFPDEKHGANINNCATFPTLIGIPIPEETGQLRYYIPQLQASGQLWKGKAT